MQYTRIASRLVLGHLWLLLQQTDSRVGKTLRYMPSGRQPDDATPYNQEIRASCFQRSANDVGFQKIEGYVLITLQQALCFIFLPNNFALATIAFLETQRHREHRD